MPRQLTSYFAYPNADGEYGPAYTAATRRPIMAMRIQII
jgi:hypothetical protein